MKQIEQFPNYLISKDGIIINKINGKRKSIQTNYKNGYQSTILYKKNENKRLYVHRLVAITYLLNPDNKREVNHINGIKTDNRVENLEWVTAKENSIHGLRFKNPHYNNKIVLNIKTGIFYNSIKEASNYHYLNYNIIKKRLISKKGSDFVYV